MSNLSKLISCLLLFVATGSLPTYASDARDFRLSFHHLLLEEAPNAFQRNFKEGCVDKIRTALKGGKNFDSEEVRDQTIPLSKFKRKHPEYKNRFFHWTRAETMKDIAKRNDPDAIYSFLRITRGNSFLWNQSLFVADEPFSTSPRGTAAQNASSYGDILISVNLKPTSNVIDLDADFSTFANHWFSDHFSEISECGQPISQGDALGGPISYLILEASGADLVLYTHQTDSAWYFLLNPLSIDTMRYELNSDSINP